VPKSLASALFVLVLCKDPQTLNPNRLQFLCLCATAAGTVGVSSRQQLLVLNATDGCVAWAVPFTPAASVRITSAWYCILVLLPSLASHTPLQRAAGGHLLHYSIDSYRVRFFFF
jgi:hypothetical protein